ncbi:homoserine dehydrogenase (HDH) [Afipia carboxidovorans OM5]|uniref:Homoserine dehydrogenase n=1 Tax=Afipia carboxidovorans (strain ATCC 49405 / DSM 1227 / KCTC 32145 / OM5) TaxID=504832 RepID=B6JHH0_AFIC5|nr:homoserine dehydrogenase [Afipia carboxidovorans]ACI93136.1 homoserine dehydrogenase (HDH) [Afipia carboxidovorans OM5]AEI03140.1 homoserine dehydrogenase Hom [Afipia carboxidovorans OM4]AEI06717.1 homoserine dehydrogenase Hom [Afipia carboxidovorans OM5]BEV44002.1 homoserine dehydrogenase [Afipia carboxidovorans]
MVAPLRVGIAGLGTVGAEVVGLIERQKRTLSLRCGRSVRVVAVSARSKAKKRNVDLSGIAWAKNALAIATDPKVDVFVELMGGVGDPALSAIEAALRSGKSVVTANKALIAKHGSRLAMLAEKHGGALNYEAAVGAAIPIVKTLREGLAGTGIDRVYGILNGTCNYILTRMEQEGLSFAECLKDAQRLGYAEANPSFDVDGHDTAQKLAILASLAFGTKVNQSAVYVEGISSIAPEDLRAAQELGYRVKLLGVAVKTETGIEQRVHPTMVPRISSIAQVMDVTNAVTIDGEGIPPITLVGPGAGGAATASAVVADIADIARGVRALPFGRPVAKLKATAKAPMRRHEGGYYIRLMARDLTGTAATIAKRLAEQKISIESIVQRHPNGGAASVNGKSQPVPVILITYATTEDAVRRALQAVKQDRVITGRPQVIRIEKN